jgi:2-keto-4-pentenoate hydratase/2-oxohepta-3-ene-1,7-dioic acid hydratase in catechol pathway
VKLVRFVADRATHAGCLEDGYVQAGGKRWPLAGVKLLAPCEPTKIVCVGRNYAAHAAELGNAPPAEPMLFLKPPSAVNHPYAPIVFPPQSRQVDFEGELGVVIARRCKRVSRESAAEVIRGYTVVNDVTARDLQRTDGQWARAKGFDTFAPIGPCIATDVDPTRLRIVTRLNGEVRQDCATSELIFDVALLLEYITAAFTLEAGDVIATGTPSGVGPMRVGDTVQVEIEGIGVLENRVVAFKA